MIKNSITLNRTRRSCQDKVFRICQSRSQRLEINCSLHHVVSFCCDVWIPAARSALFGNKHTHTLSDTTRWIPWQGLGLVVRLGNEPKEVTDDKLVSTLHEKHYNLRLNKLLQQTKGESSYCMLHESRYKLPSLVCWICLWWTVTLQWHLLSFVKTVCICVELIWFSRLSQLFFFFFFVICFPEEIICSVWKFIVYHITLEILKF